MGFGAEVNAQLHAFDIEYRQFVPRDEQFGLLLSEVGFPVEMDVARIRYLLTEGQSF